MLLPLGARSAVTAFWLVALLAGDAPGAGQVDQALSEKSPAAAKAREAIHQGLAFLQSDAETWRKERKCSSCHHGTMTVWAFRMRVRTAIGNVRMTRGSYTEGTITAIQKRGPA